MSLRDTTFDAERTDLREAFRREFDQITRSDSWNRFENAGRMMKKLAYQCRESHMFLEYLSKIRHMINAPCLTHMVCERGNVCIFRENDVKISCIWPYSNRFRRQGEGTSTIETFLYVRGEMLHESRVCFETYGDAFEYFQSDVGSLLNGATRFTDI